MNADTNENKKDTQLTPVDDKVIKRQEEKKEDEHDEEEELGGSMTFLEHLVELRGRLIRALVAFAIACVLCFIFSDRLVGILLDCIPQKAQDLTQQDLEKVIAELLAQNNAGQGASESPASATAVESPKNATSSIIIKEFISKISIFSKDGESVVPIVASPVEMIITLLKVAMVAGLFLAFPIIFYQAWMFIAPGLYKREKKLVLPVVITSWICFVTGGLFCYFVVFRFALSFFASMAMGIAANMWRVSEYLTFMIRFLLAFGIVFEEPVVIFLLAKAGLVTREGLSKFRPYAIVAMFALAALITPPDPLSQIMCAAPLLVLYEVSLVIVGIIERKQAANE